MRTMIRVDLIALLFVAIMFTCGCGGSPANSCIGSVVVTVTPSSAMVNHAAAPPGNQVQFVGYAAPSAPPGCPVPAWVVIDYATWSNPDPVDIQISSANDKTNGTAVCKAPTDGAVTLTGIFTSLVATPITKSVQLTCE